MLQHFLQSTCFQSRLGGLGRTSRRLEVPLAWPTRSEKLLVIASFPGLFWTWNEANGRLDEACLETGHANSRTASQQDEPGAICSVTSKADRKGEKSEKFDRAHQ